MDADAFVQKYSSLANYEADSIVASFIMILSIIDRTVLPRKITFSNEVSSLKLAVTERRARLLNQSRHNEDSVDGSADLVQQLASICRRGPVRYAIRSLNSSSAHGYSIAQLINSQYLARPCHAFDDAFVHTISDRYSFDQMGWPIAMPSNASAGALENAWRSNLRARRGLESARKACGSKVLMIMISPDASAKIAVHASPTRIDLLQLNAADTGRLISTWKTYSNTE